MVSNDLGLEQRVESYDLANLGGTGQFERRLCREQGWSSRFTARVIAEYRRFLVLSASAPHPVSPSKIVDEAWHLHLLHTKEYWETFCPKVLGKALHHTPARADKEDKLQHAQWYAQTIEAYQTRFGELPPRDIWMPVGTNTGTRLSGIVSRKAFLWLAVAAAAFALLWSQSAWASEFDDALNFSGPEFLWFYIKLVALAAAVSVLVPLGIFLASPTQGQEFPELTPQEIGYIRDGRRGAVLATIAKLQGDGVIASNDDGKLIVTAAETGRDNSLSYSVYRAIAEGKSPSNTRAVLDACRVIEQRLVSRKLFLSPTEIGAMQLVPLLSVILVLLFGVMKVGIGISRGRPVIFLVFIMIAVAIAGISWLSKLPRHSRAGRAHLRQLRLKFERLSIAPKREELALAAAMFGPGVLLSSALAAYARTQLPTVRGDSAGGSSCGTGGCGSSCGGGCGGCS